MQHIVYGNMNSKEKGHVTSMYLVKHCCDRLLKSQYYSISIKVITNTWLTDGMTLPSPAVMIDRMPLLDVPETSSNLTKTLIK